MSDQDYYVQDPSDLVSLSAQPDISFRNLTILLLAPLRFEENQIASKKDSLILDISALARSWRRALLNAPRINNITFSLSLSTPVEGARVISWDPNMLSLPGEFEHYQRPLRQLQDGSYTGQVFVESAEEAHTRLTLTANRIAIRGDEVRRMVIGAAMAVSMKTRKGVYLRASGDERTMTGLVESLESDLRSLSPAP
jgi:hypothetical protein